ncbi:Formin-like protein 1 [Heterocephalus glaber]|uniref:Formin-like protein 1 n=1 Tax=Heterocephalus glaber TaxID=10181 RepID=G5BIY9_HETGA|nr:Formin-like protein 1 [Heterocephalus glaber]
MAVPGLITWGSRRGDQCPLCGVGTVDDGASNSCEGGTERPRELAALTVVVTDVARGAAGLSQSQRVSNCMNLPPDKVQLLSQYDDEKKWELICDQERFQVKNPPEAYIQKLKSYLDVGGVGRKVAADWMSNLGFKRRSQESTQVLRELETSLRTNHIGWVQEFLNKENRGLDVLLEYLAFAQCSVTYDVESTDSGEKSEKSKPLEQSVEDLSKGPPPSVARSRHLTVRLTPVHSRKTLRGSRLVSQKDDVHVCIMCLRAIMNYQSGFSLVMNHPACVNEIALSLNNNSPRTKALVLELLAAVCLVRGGHDIILSAFDNFKEVCGEQHRFERLMEYFHKEDSNIDFMVACMQFINIVVHSVENMNFRVFLQYEFTNLGLDLDLERLRLTESDKLRVQIQAYLDNVFDVSALLEDTETKNALLEHMEELQEQTTQVRRGHRGRVKCRAGVGSNCGIRRSSDGLCQLPFSGCCLCAWSVKCFLIPQNNPVSDTLMLSCVTDIGEGPASRPGVKARKPVQTKFRMPLLNWVALNPSQISGTVFTELDDEKVLQELDMSDFEEQFKTKSQGPSLDLSALKGRATQKGPSQATLIEANRAKNLAITLRKGNLGADRICQAIETYDLQALGLDFLELLTRFLPTEYERSLIARFERERRPLEELSEEDCFMLRFSRIPRLPERMATLSFLGSFLDTAQLLMPQLNAVIAASMSIKSSDKLRQILEIVLAFGNYMNSSKRGAAYGFRLQSLDTLLEMKSTDRKQTLLHYLVKVIGEKYPQLSCFHSDLHFLDKAGTVSLDSVLADVRSLQRGLEVAQREFVRQDDCTVLKDVLADVRSLQRGLEVAQREDDCTVLKEFLRANSPTMDKLLADSRTAQEAYDSVVEYFGENPKTTPPAVFFCLFSRFTKAYKKAEQEVEQWKKAAAAQEAGLDTPGRGEAPVPKVGLGRGVAPLTVLWGRGGMGTGRGVGPDPGGPQSPPRARRQQMDLISELKRKQQKEPLVYESDRDGAIEDIITVLKTAPFTARTGKRTSRLLYLRNQPYIRADTGRRSARRRPPVPPLQVTADLAL